MSGISALAWLILACSDANPATSPQSAAAGGSGEQIDGMSGSSGMVGSAVGAGGGLAQSGAGGATNSAGSEAGGGIAGANEGGNAGAPALGGQPTTGGSSNNAGQGGMQSGEAGSPNAGGQASGGTAGNGSAGSSGGTAGASPGFDVFGIEMLRATKSPGFEWNSLHWSNGNSHTFDGRDPDDPTGWSIKRGNGNIMEVDGQGVMAMGGNQPRFYVQPPTGETEPFFRDVEFTGYYRRTADDGAFNAGFVVGMRAHLDGHGDVDHCLAS
ncbi:MAG TPA: hypothetical protein VHO25_20220, partial [Polyangiaceae bacterium]|nr:hypothetical protein [Polyangiaceae bacterium]